MEKIEMNLKTSEYLKNQALETIKKMGAEQNLVEIEGATDFYVSREKNTENMILLESIECEGKEYFIFQKKVEI